MNDLMTSREDDFVIYFSLKSREIFRTFYNPSYLCVFINKVFLGKTVNSLGASLRQGVKIGTKGSVMKKKRGCNLTMDCHPIKRGVVILVLAKETGISSGRVGYSTRVQTRSNLVTTMYNSLVTMKIVYL